MAAQDMHTRNKAGYPALFLKRGDTYVQFQGMDDKGWRQDISK